MDIEEIGYVEEIRQRLGLEFGDTSRDAEIEQMEPMERVRQVVGWYLGDGSWTDTLKGYCESQGIYWTVDPEAAGIIHD